MLQLPTALIAKICCKISKKFSYMQKKTPYFCIFFQKYLRMSKKSSTFAPAFEKESNFLPWCYRLVA